MGLDLDAWKTKVSEYIKPRASLFKQAGADLIYGLLGASALRPILLTDDDPSETIIPVLDNPGTGLIVNMVQGWKDKTDEAVAREILGATQANAELRQAMDELLFKLKVIPAFIEGLSRTDQQLILETLHSELARLQSSIKIEVETGGSAVVYSIVMAQNHNSVDREQNIYCSNPLLPSPDLPTDFVGRAVVLEELVNAAQGGNILIHGLSGMGKTALGMMLAHQLAAQYPDGQIYINLRGASSNPMTPAAALKQLIYAFKPMRKLPEDMEQLTNIYRDLLANQRILIFLDDARDAAQVSALLPPRPALAIVTSRKCFDPTGYHTCEVSALPLDDASKLICAVWGSVADVTALAQRCGCLPIALRAAGALLRRRPDLTPKDVDELLTDAARRLVLADHEWENLTVAVSFQASYDQLSPELQTCWRSLSIFPTDFGTAAAAAVWEDTANPSDILANLHTAGLVDSMTGDRWRLHGLTSDYTRFLCEPTEQETLAYRHAAYYLKVLEECSHLHNRGYIQLLFGPLSKNIQHIVDGLAQFDRERGNIEAGQAWSAARPNNPAAQKLCNAYPNAGISLLEERLHPRALIAWLEAALTAALALDLINAQKDYLDRLAKAWVNLGEPRRAIECIEHHLAIITCYDEMPEELIYLKLLGDGYRSIGDLYRAIGYYEQALIIERKIGNEGSKANLCWDLGLLLEKQGKLSRAIEMMQVRVDYLRSISDPGAEKAAARVEQIRQKLE